MDPKACAPRVGALGRQIDSLRGRQEEIAAQLERLALPPLDLDEVAAMLQDFERRFESDSNPERKHLLHRLVKEVRVQSKSTAEVWYAFPRPPATDGRFVDSQIWLGALVSLRVTRRIPFSSGKQPISDRRGKSEMRGSA